jgi:hypothetical protein
MTTMLTTLEGESDTQTDNLFVADNGKVYERNSLNGNYYELGSVEEIYNLGLDELSGDSNFEELLNGDELEGDSVDLYIHENGKVYFKSSLGGYSELGSVEEILGCGASELSGNDKFVEILDGDELGKGFKFKAPKMKFKAPKMKFKAPKIKMKVNTKGLSKGFRSVGNAVSKGVKAYGNAWKSVGKLAEKGLKAAGGALSQVAESLLDQNQPEQPQEEEQAEEESEDQNQEQSEEQPQDNEQPEDDEQPEEMDGFKTDEQGKKFYYSELSGKFIELGSDELGFMSMLTNMASGGGKGGGGILSMATGALDMVVPGAGTVANIGIGAAQKQRQKQKEKKAKNNATRKNLLRHYQNKKINPVKQIKQSTSNPTKPSANFNQAEILNQMPKQSRPIAPSQIMQSRSTTPIRYNNNLSNARDSNVPTQVQTDKKNQIMMGVGAAVLAVIVVMYSMNSKKGRK